MAHVVDVFRRTRKVNELGCVAKFGIGLKLFFNEIFHGFDIVVGGGFDFLDAQGILFRKVALNGIQFANGLAAERGQFGKASLRQRFEPFNFYNDPVVHKA